MSRPSRRPHRIAAIVVPFLLAGLALAAATAWAQGASPDLYRQSYTLEAKGDINGALALMKRIGTESRPDYVYELRTGWLLYLAARHGESVAAYQRAITLEPDAVEPRLGVMLPLMADRRWKEAERYGAAVLAAAPGESTAQARVAYIHYILGQYDRAESDYRKALRAWPANVELRAGLGWSLLKQGKTRDARAEFDKVLSIAPDHASAKEGRAAVQ